MGARLRIAPPKRSSHERMAASAPTTGRPPGCTHARNERSDDARGSLLDLLDDWGLERAEGDDVVVTSRTYSVYDAEYPGFDGENMEG